ncbi:AAA family ATPase [Pseudacidovorax sp. RU35E]|jgi:energy-coupling factor transporter ATP-binding protein EcfA2|uniref:AAA family ATPase n=1 Tax=Pseudacidovorax sp. RU35E TaxID=1907403 RepID=UPI00095446A8|nr:AAA family ATPase [Pseudacidovorax sp. RU35E]SIQ01439.1 Predicted ATP-dependent endonuclease of the OLD family, contains P-loop ATPase and TOPRIM domains [Pseudacidovorax sp. RU35E]
MKLVKAHVTNFRSAEDSGEFEIGQVVCLVGKNEAGKSALLQALAALNPHPSTPQVFDKERDYPRRHLASYAERHPTDGAVGIVTEWDFEDKELAELDGMLGEGAVERRVQVQRIYGGNFTSTPRIDFKKAVSHLLERFEVTGDDLVPLSAATTTDELLKALKAVEARTDAQSKLQAHLESEGNATKQVNNFISRNLPKFMYVSSYDRMDGTVQFQLIQSLQSQNLLNRDEHRGKKLFLEFLQYAGISLNELLKQNTYETYNALLQAASNKITDQILEYWTQNPDLTVEVKVSTGMQGDPPPFNEGTVARARIYNTLHRVDTPFSERSAGFVWFFSFLVKFAQIKNEATPVILLLDEPGLTLHGKAQADLLRFFNERLAPHHQVIFSTHSPFMVPVGNFASVRIVQDVIELKGSRRVPLGTKVRDDVLTQDPDTLFPLQAALGYEVTQSLFVGKNTLLVEGPGDILYIQALSDALRRRKRQALDRRWTICPAGGIDKIRPFASLFSGNALNIAVLSDQAAGDKRKIEDLRKSQILKAGQFHTIADLLGRPEADIEDLLAPGLLVEILNAAYQLTGPHALTVKKLDEADKATSRLIKKAEAFFRLLPQTIDMLDHFAPAAWLVRHGEILDATSAEVNETLDRAQAVFETFNELLKD